MGWIRVWGIAVFAALVLVVALFSWLFVDWIVERAVEETGTGLVGARVELASADVGLFPISLALHGLQVTNPDEPMSNAVEIRRIAAGVDALPLLRRKVLIDELALEGVRFGTPREKSGAVASWSQRTEEAVTRKVEALELPSFEKPDVQKILAEEELESLAVIEEAQREVEGITRRWKERLEELPDEARFREYEERFAQLQGGGGVAGAVRGAEDVLALQKEVRRDLDALQEAAAGVEEDTERVRALAERAAAAPGNDVRRLRDKYGLSPEGMANLSSRLLGPRVASWTAQALQWWRRIEPIVTRIQLASDAGAEAGAAEPVRNLRGRGSDVRFPERDPLPDFLIRRARVGVELEAGSFSGTIDDITPDQPVHGRPLTLAFLGENLKELRRVELRGVMDRVRPAAASDDLSLTVEGLALAALVLSESDVWGLLLEQGTLDLDGVAKRTGEQISAEFSGLLDGVKLEPRFAASGPVASAMADTLSGIRRFDFGALVRGTLEQYDIEVKSDIDGLLRQSVAKLVSGQMRALEAQLQEGVGARTSGPLAALQGGVSDVGGIEKQVASRIDLGDGVLSRSALGKKLPGGLRLPF